MLIIGIDPGLDGALCVLKVEGFTRSVVSIHDMPTHTEQLSGSRTRRRLDPEELLRLLWAVPDEPRLVVLERVSASPGMGVVSAFSFGHGVGVLQGCLPAIWPGAKIIQPPPSRWKPAMSAPACKDASRDRASVLLPDAASHWTRKKDHGRAEAAMLALYGAHVLEGRTSHATRAA
jgi:crossover junction endodeoxyribonuclease RuvC